MNLNAKTRLKRKGTPHTCFLTQNIKKLHPFIKFEFFEYFEYFHLPSTHTHIMHILFIFTKTTRIVSVFLLILIVFRFQSIVGHAIDGPPQPVSTVSPWNESTKQKPSSSSVMKAVLMECPNESLDRRSVDASRGSSKAMQCESQILVKIGLLDGHSVSHF